MFRRFAAAGALAFAVLAAAPVAAADGPMPYASQGGSGVLMPDGLTRLVAVGVGAVVVGLLVTRWSRRRAPPAAEPLDPALERRVDEELARFEG